MAYSNWQHVKEVIDGKFPDNLEGLISAASAREAFAALLDLIKNGEDDGSISTSQLANGAVTKQKVASNAGLSDGQLATAGASTKGGIKISQGLNKPFVVTSDTLTLVTGNYLIAENGELDITPLDEDALEDGAVTSAKLNTDLLAEIRTEFLSPITVSAIEAGSVTTAQKQALIGAVGSKEIFLENGAVPVSYHRTGYSTIVFEFVYGRCYYRLNEDLEVVSKIDLQNADNLFFSTISISKFRAREYTHEEIDALYDAVRVGKMVFIIAESNQETHTHTDLGIIPCVSRLEGWQTPGSTLKVVLECQYGFDNVVIEVVPSGSYDCLVTEDRPMTDEEVDALFV